MPGHLLSVRDLTKAFGGFIAVDCASFELEEGEIFGLIGPNGSGKSTTFNLIAGTLAPTPGSIRLREREIGGLYANRVAHMGVGRTFQIPRPFRKPASCRCSRTSRLRRITGSHGSRAANVHTRRRAKRCRW